MPLCLESSWSYVIRIREGHAGGCRNGGGELIQEWCSRITDLPTHKHGVIFVDGIVAVLHVHSAKVSELQCQGHAPARTQTIYILASFFPRRHVTGAAVAGQDLSLL